MQNEPKVYCAHSKMADMKSLQPNPKNPNTHPSGQIDILARVIRENGWRAPITVSNRSGFVTKGHGRLLAARTLGLKTVPVDFQDYSTEAAEIQDMIADNKIAEFSVMDDKILEELFEDLVTETDSFSDLELTGIDTASLKAMLKDLTTETQEPTPEPKQEFDTYEEQELSHECPKCGFKFN